MNPGSRTHTDHEVTGIRWLTDDTFVLRTTRRELKFEAGQLVSLGPRGLGVNREYSIYSGTGEDHLEFLIRKIRGGTVSIALSSLKKGDRVFILGPYSDFKITQKNLSTRPYVFVATGTGIAPFRSMIRSHPSLDFRILHGIRSASETYDRDEYHVDRYLACVSGERNASKGTFPGRVTDFLRAGDFPKDAIFYLCGNNRMITDAFPILRAAGIAPDDIHTEVFF